MRKKTSIVDLIKEEKITLDLSRPPFYIFWGTLSLVACHTMLRPQMSDVCHYMLGILFTCTQVGVAAVSTSARSLDTWQGHKSGYRVIQQTRILSCYRRLRGGVT